MMTVVVKIGLSAAIVALVVGCASSVTDSATTPTSLLDGRYVLITQRFAASCSPQALPDPTTLALTQYVQLSTSNESDQQTVDVQVKDSAMSLVPESSSGVVLDSLALSGSFTTNVAYVTRSSVRTEGPRAGGHTFSVSQSVADTAQFTGLVETPPGNRIEVEVSGRGMETFTFRDGGPSGAIFTTCSVVENLTGGKLP